MTIQATTVQLRETILGSLLKQDSQGVLNPAHSGSAARPADRQNPDRQIMRAVNTFKAIAMDSQGIHVDYARLAASPEFRRFKTESTPILAGFDPVTLETTPRRLAFWINLYNALVIDAVISFGVQNSVTEGWLGLFKFFRRAAYNVGGHRLSLEDIEHGILRANRGHPYLPGPQFKKGDPRLPWCLTDIEPRVHFSLNCASRSCPPVGVYTPEQIDFQLDLATQNFMDSEVALQPEQNTLTLSQIFKWYAADFNGRDGVVDFVVRHLQNGPEKAWLQSGPQLKIVYKTYDWQLNR